MRSGRHSDERGAVAVMVGVMAILLLGLCALAVDLGQAWATKQHQQREIDFATLSGIQGDNLPGTVSGTCSYGNRANSTDRAIQDVSVVLAKEGFTRPGSSGLPIRPQDLTDCVIDGTNPEAVYGTLTFPSGSPLLAYNKNQLTVVANEDVDFGFAAVFGSSGTTVSAKATGEIRSLAMNTLPMYAFSGCDYGPQTLSQPNNGHSSAAVLLYADPGTDSTGVKLNAVSPTAYPVDTSATAQPITITGLGFKKTGTTISEIGFFEPGNGVPGPTPVTTTSFTVVSDTQITLADIPNNTKGVSGVQSFWYIRVNTGTAASPKWSKVDNSKTNPQFNAPMLTIGSPPLICGQGSSSGNFGTLLLSHDPYNGADKIGAANVALGLTHSLSIFPSATAPTDGTCTGTTMGAKLWPTDGTNCVDTDTGMSANIATGGFLGIGSAAPSPGPGLLAKPSTTMCGKGGTEPARAVVMGVNINNDTLSCFFLDPGTKVADVVDKNYVGDPLISRDILDSPRFGYVPVLPVQPGNGGSKKYQIVDFRPAFITDQVGSAQRGDAPSATNGVTTDNNGVQSIQVVFLNRDAVPWPTSDKTIPFVGTGQRIPLLIN